MAALTNLRQLQATLGAEAEGLTADGILSAFELALHNDVKKCMDIKQQVTGGKRLNPNKIDKVMAPWFDAACK
jgi:hypothetical protein